MLIGPFLISALAHSGASDQLVLRRDPGHVTVDNGLVHLSLDTQSGTYGVEWAGSGSISDVSGEVRLADGKVLRTTEYPIHASAVVDEVKVKDGFGSGLRIAVHHRNAGLPELLGYFWIYERSPEIFVRLAAVGTGPVGSSYLAPIVTRSQVHLTAQGTLQALYVPYDNDSYSRYDSDGWGRDSFEVSAIYDSKSRTGIVVGSLDHDKWKSAVRFENGSLGLTAYAGASSKDTHDTQPHGVVSGPDIQSPRMSIGCYSDWRKGLERFGDLNAIVQPKLGWSGSVPFGWSSWSGHKDKVQAKDAETAATFFEDKLHDFRSDGTAYLNLDSFWDNMTQFERRQFVAHAHAAGMRAGIYWTPFTAWGNLTDKVAGDSRTYGELALKNSKGNPIPKLDGGWPLDPTHPGTLARIDRELADFVDQGFDLIKLDFMTHGALEGQHTDRSVTTGTAAYTVGMKRIVEDLSEKKVGRPIFICLSIAPLFPQGFGHSRRISCDVFANIGATEYLLNAVTYAWWINNRLYRFNDPDSACVYQPLGEPPVSEAESRSRFTASAIVDGMLIEGDDLTKPSGRDRVQQIFSNEEIVALARKSLAFWPMSGDSGSKAGETFEWISPNGRTAYVASFNYSKEASATRTLRMDRLGLPSTVGWSVHDLWTGKNDIATSSLSVTLAPCDCSLVCLTRR